MHTLQAAFRLGVTTPAVMSAVIVPVLLRGLCDRLPNVRLSAARVAEDILSVAAISSWPPPGGRSGGSRERGSAGGGGGDRGDIAERSLDVPAVADGDGDGDGADNFVVITAEVAAESGAGGGGGEWWGCRWEEVERRLELVSAEDPDRDASYFATQAIKPKWMGDSPGRCRGL